MEKESNIQPMQSDFEQIKKVTDKGKEYWSARELATALCYSTWQKFNRVLNKALKVAQERDMDMSEHFNQVVEMVKLGKSRVEMTFNGQTFWLTQKRMSDLYGVDVSTINYHLGEIYETGELKEEATIRKFPIVQMEGDRKVNRSQLVYNLDAIIAVGYRVNSYQATQFRFV